MLECKKLILEGMSGSGEEGGGGGWQRGGEGAGERAEAAINLG